MSSVTIQNVTKTFGNTTVLENFDAVFADGEFITLLGPSGCDKTTMLRIIAGFEKPTSGSVLFDDRVVSSDKVFIPPEKRDIGMVFQSYAVWPHMTVFDNVAYPLQIKKVDKAAIKQKVERVLDVVHLAQYRDRIPSQLSGGQQQRVALARILCSRPKAILLDEPFSALDGFLKWNLELELSDLLSRFNGPIVWVSHDLGECRRNCSQVCVMENGLAGRIMGLDELIRRPDSLSAARLAGYKNFFPCRACEGGVFVPDWGLTLRGISAGPEHSLLAVGPDAVDLSGKAYAFRVLRVIQDVGHNVVLLRPDGASENAPVLRIEAAPENVPQPGSVLTLSLRPASLLLF